MSESGDAARGCNDRNSERANRNQNSEQHKWRFMLQDLTTAGSSRKTSAVIFILLARARLAASNSADDNHLVGIPVGTQYTRNLPNPKSFFVGVPAPAAIWAAIGKSQISFT